MTHVYWEAERGEARRQATVRGAHELGVPEVLDIVVAVSDGKDLRGHASYIQLSVPGLGPVLAWVGVPSGGRHEGHFIHPQSGRTWPRGDLRLAVKFAMAH